MQNPFSKKNLVTTMWPGIVSAGPSVLLGATLSPELFAVSPSLILLTAGFNALRGTQAAHVVTGKRHRERVVQDKELTASQQRAQAAYIQESFDALTDQEREWLATQIRVAGNYLESNPEVKVDLEAKLFTTRRHQILAKLRPPTIIKGLDYRPNGSYVTTASAPSKGRDNCKCTQCRLYAFQSSMGDEYQVLNSDGSPIRLCEKDKEAQQAKLEKKASGSPKALESSTVTTSNYTIIKNLDVHAIMGYLSSGLIKPEDYHKIVSDVTEHGKKALLVKDKFGNKRVVTSA